MPKVPFTYLSISSSNLKLLHSHTGGIRALVQRSGKDIIRIGEKLTEVKSLLEHGEFLEWLDKEFSWKKRTAQNFMQVSDKFKNANFAHLDIGPSALYLLSSPSTPGSVVKKFVNKAKDKPVTHKEVKKAIDKEKKKSSPPPEPVADTAFRVPKNQKKQRGKHLIVGVRNKIGRRHYNLYSKQLSWSKDGASLNYFVGEIVEQLIDLKRTELLGELQEVIDLLCDKIEEGKIDGKFGPETLFKQWPNLTRFLENEKTQRLVNSVKEKGGKDGELFP